MVERTASCASIELPMKLCASHPESAVFGRPELGWNAPQTSQPLPRAPSAHPSPSFRPRTPLGS